MRTTWIKRKAARPPAQPKSYEVYDYAYRSNTSPCKFRHRKRRDKKQQDKRERDPQQQNIYCQREKFTCLRPASLASRPAQRFPLPKPVSTPGAVASSSSGRCFWGTAPLCLLDPSPLVLDRPSLVGKMCGERTTKRGRARGRERLLTRFVVNDFCPTVSKHVGDLSTNSYDRAEPPGRFSPPSLAFSTAQRQTRHSAARGSASAYFFSEAGVGKQCVVQRETGLTYCMPCGCPPRLTHTLHACWDRG